MSIKHKLKQHKDLLLTLFFSAVIYLVFHLKGITKQISSDVFLQLYIAIFAVVFTVFAIFILLDDKIFYNIEKKGYKPIVSVSFKIPMFTSIAGVIVTIIGSFLDYPLIYLLNLTILIYASLSSLVLFNDFIFEIIFKFKIKKYKDSENKSVPK